MRAAGKRPLSVAPPVAVPPRDAHWSLLLDDPRWPLTVLELGLRGVLYEARDFKLANEDIVSMLEPLFALAHDARRAAERQHARANGTEAAR